MKNLRLFLPIAKVDVEKREVYGRATQEVADRSGEIFDYATSKPLFAAWSAGFEKVTDGKSLGNIRAMHGKVAAGKVTQIDFNDDEKAIDIATKIVDEAEWQKVLEGVYTGFSIGGAYVKRWKDTVDAALTRFTADPSEISIVDHPCVPTATFAMVKADGTTEAKPFQRLALLKSALAGPITNGDLYALATEYLPADVLNTLAKAEGTMPDLRAQLVKLSEEEPVVEEAAAADPEKAPEPVKTDDAPAPDAAAETEKARKVLGKSMWTVGRLADLLCTVSSIALDAQYEADYEKDGSTIPAEIRTWLADGVNIFKRMGAEEADELLASITPAAAVAEMAAQADLKKAAAAETELVAKFVAGDLQKRVDNLTAENAGLVTKLATVEAERDEIAKGAEALLVQKRGALRAVPKAADQPGTEKAAATDGPPTDAKAELKKSFQNPIVFGSAPTRT